MTDKDLTAPLEDILVFAQDSKIKGLRIIRFKKVRDTGCNLKWLGPVGEPDDPVGHYYSETELLENGWIRMEE